MGFKNWLFLILIVFPIISQSQDHIEKNDSIYSRYLQETRQIQISVPKKYDPKTMGKLDVLYILDGEWASSLTKTAYEFLEYAKFIPTNILIVSIPNKYDNGKNMRRRDFIPMKVKGGNISQGATNFLLFLKEELIPMINKKYQVNPQNNTLYGSSLGGLFTVYTFLSEPTLFKSYLAIEPVLQYADNYINKFAEEQLENRKEFHETIWISSRKGKPFKAMGSFNFESILQSKNPKGLRWQITTYENETHFSVIWKGLYDGLKFVYKKQP